MKNRISFALFWAGVLLLAAALVHGWPVRVGAGPRPGFWPEEQEAASDWPDVTRVVHCGCMKQYPVVMAGSTGYRLEVWADYIEKEKGQAHDWEKWLSFRSGKKASEKADKDCREWIRELFKRIEKARAERR